MQNSNTQLTQKVFKVQEFQGEFGEQQRRLRYEEGLEWRRRSLGFNKFAPPRAKLPLVSDIVY